MYRAQTMRITDKIYKSTRPPTTEEYQKQKTPTDEPRNPNRYTSDPTRVYRRIRSKLKLTCKYNCKTVQLEKTHSS